MNPDLLNKFFQFLYEDRKGYVEIRQLQGGYMKNYFYPWPDASYLSLISGDPKDTFMGVLLRRDQDSGKAENCEHEVNVLWADVDKKTGATFVDLTQSLLPVPNVVVDSGHGWHLYWKLASPVSHDKAQKLMENISDLLGGDRVGDPARILRVPTTYNRKGDGRVPVRILRLNSRYSSSSSDFEVVTTNRSDKRIRRLSVPINGKTAGTRSEDLFFVAVDGLLKGKDPETIYKEMLDHPSGTKLLEMKNEHRRRLWVDLTLKNARKNIWPQPEK